MMNHIQRVSFAFRLLLQATFLLLPTLLMLGWSAAPETLVLFKGLINIDFIPRSYNYLILHPLTLNEKMIALFVSLPSLIVEMFIVYWLIKLFRTFEKNDVFSVQNIHTIRNIGYALLVTQLISPIYEFMMGIVLTMNNPVGHRLAKITFDQTNIAVLLTGFLVILISWIITEGYRLREEQQLTI